MKILIEFLSNTSLSPGPKDSEFTLFYPCHKKNKGLFIHDVIQGRGVGESKPKYDTIWQRGG